RAGRRLPRRRRQARRAGGAAGVPAAVRDQLLLVDHAAGIEREPAVRRQRVSLAAGSLSARRADDRLLPGAVSRRRDAVAAARDPMTRRERKSEVRLMVRPITHRAARALVVALLLSGTATFGIVAQTRATTGGALPTVVVLATGGTIAGAAASDVQAAYTSGQVGVDQLLAEVPQAKKLATLRGEQIAN